MGSKYALRGNQRQAQVLFVAGICWTLAAQEQRRRQRVRKSIINVFLVGFYIGFAVYLSTGAMLLQKGDIWGAIFCVVVFYNCGLAIAGHAATKV